jgi:uncharacterized membrane protein
VLRHRTYHSLGFDLGVYDQAIWSTTQGRVLESTMTQANPIPHSQLSDHFSPVYLMLVPFYYLYPHPETLLILQTLALALGAWPVYLLAKLKLPPPYALVWVLVYLLFVPLAYVNLYDFHEVAFAVAPLGLALYFLERGRRLWFVVFLLLTFLVKEEMALVAAGFGVYALLGKREWKLGLGVLVGSIAAFALLVQVVIPYFSGGATYPYFSLRYADVGGSPSGIARTVVTNPLRIAHALVQPKKIYFLIAVFGPVLGLSVIAGWAALILLPTLSYLLLSNYEPEFSFSTQYSAPLIPLIVGTAIIAMSKLPRAALPYLTVAVVAATLAFSWAYGFMPYSRKFDPSLFQIQARYAAFVPALAQIPSDARVSAENGFPSHFSERRFIYDYGFQGVQDADWVILDYEGTNYNLAVFNDQVAHVESLGYQEVASGQGLALLRKP